MDLRTGIVLPVSQHYGKTAFNMPTLCPMSLTIRDAAGEPPGAARSEWEARRRIETNRLFKGGSHD